MEGCGLCLWERQSYRLIGYNDSCYAMICKAPLKPGHVIVLPKRHVLSASDFSTNEASEFLDLIERVKNVVQEKYGEGLLVVQHGRGYASEKHLHYHVLPSKGSLRTLVSSYEGVLEREEIPREGLRAMRDLILNGRKSI
ncbi:MAG: HIT domain-containing protein [Nanoarchaeota archaeon]